MTTTTTHHVQTTTAEPIDDAFLAATAAILAQTPRGETASPESVRIERMLIDKLDRECDRLNERDCEFATSLVTQFNRRGRLSPKQWPWVGRMLERCVAPKGPGTNGPTTFAPLVAIFDSAAEHRRWPKIKLADVDGNGPLVLARAGSQSRLPGTINVTNGKSFGDPDNVWFGRVDRDGRFHPSRNCEDWVIDALTSLAAAPAEFGADYGRRTGSCCFCGRLLTDDRDGRSVERGYGPVCASNWGLPWGGGE